MGGVNRFYSGGGSWIIGASGLGEATGGVLRLPLGGGASVAFSSQPWPNRHRSRSIQKGAILVGPGLDLAGEGVGFGLPVAFYGGRPVFSTHASLEATDGGARKVFTMDAASTKRWSSRLLSGLPGPGALFDGWLMGNLSGMYRSRGFAQVVANGFWRLERSTGAIEHGFAPTRPRGSVSVEYAVAPGTIRVSVDPSGLSTGCERLCLMNELDARVFDSYDDSGGARLLGWRVGAWSPVDADWARFSARDGSTSFRLRRVEGARMFRGREIVPGHLSWAGLAYEVVAPLRGFGYAVEVGGPT